MNRETRRRAKRQLRRWPLALLLGALLGFSPLARPVLAQSDGEIAGWKTAFQAAPKADVAAAKAAYSALLEKLLPGMSNPDYGTQARTQDAWEKAAVNAGRPGAESERAGAVQAMMGHFGPDVPQLTRVWMIKQLGHIGRAEAVPALAALINEPDIVVRGRVLRALAENPSVEAGAALRDALGKATAPEMKVALINEVGYRRDAAATASLAAMLAPGDEVATAAAWALSRIGSADAVKALSGAKGAAAGAFKMALWDDLLQAADRMAKMNDAKNALPIYQQLWGSTEAPRLRLAGLRGVALIRGADAVPIILEQASSDDAFTQLTATRLLAEMPGKGISAAVAEKLGTLKPDMQIRMAGILAERGEAAAKPSVASLIKSADENVRLAALRALAKLGDAADVTMLAQLAASDKGETGKAARDTLARLSGEPVNAKMVQIFTSSTPEVRAVLASSLAARRAPNAASAMLAAAEKGAPTERIEAIKAVGVLGDEKVVPNLVTLIAKAPTDDFRNATAGALRDIIDNRTQDKAAAGASLAAGMVTADVLGKRALLTLMKNAGGDAALNAVKAATKDENADVQDAAVRALVAWPDKAAVPILTELAANTPKANYHALALQGVVRLAGTADYTTEERMKILQDVIANAKRVEEKRAALAGLGKVPDASALTIIVPLLDNADLREEASLAAITAAKVAGGDARRAAMQKVIASSKNADTIKAATDLMNAPSTVRPWQIVGPFPGDGAFNKDFGAEQKVDLNKTFDVMDNKKARWKTVTSDAQNGYMDLLKLFDGKESSAAYALIYVKSPSARKAWMTAGSDDGAKIWINNKNIISNDAARAANPGDEQKEVDLKEGWNEILLKITQGGGDWGYYFDLLTPDKKPMADLEWAAKPN